MKNQGFTLIELMVVITIMGIMIGIAVPNLLGGLPYRRLMDGRSQLMSDLSAIRQLAITRDTCYGLRITTNSNSYSIFRDVDRSGSFNTGDVVRTTRTLPAGITCVQTYTVSFLSSGLLPIMPHPAYLKLTNTRGNRDSILVMLSGSVFH